ncbi:pyruvate kinase [Membranihabitans maritimus]|uniref:pyruvate kinase n=1 Tax=Membranihabitans maritimus TaxID=2904244 RepID=UPI001F002CD6|nr:pyruvate kinase [Membranihabitans maritimus]
MNPSFQKTKIVATVGPSIDSYDQLKLLIETGVDVFRLNFSHGDHETHQRVINTIHQLNEEMGTYVSILADLQGPKIRVGKIKDNAIPLNPGQIIEFTTEEKIGDEKSIFINYDNFPMDVNAGERILCDDGKVIFKVIDTNKKDTVKLEVVHGKELSSRKGVNLPDTKTSLPALTEKDLKDLEFIMTQDVNWIALSFVRKAQDVLDLKERMKENNYSALVISKVEKPEAVGSIDEIIEVSDGIMVARGDLGIEVPLEQLPGIQKSIINKCIENSKPVIVATQMMDSMIHNPSPTRAEVTDVANAVFDGADAVMLSGETSVGEFPALVIEIMTKILAEAEGQLIMKGKRPKPKKDSDTYHSDVVCFTAGRMSSKIKAEGIVGFTVSGYTAFKVSSYRPDCPIFIFSGNKKTLSTLNLVWGVKCFFYDKFTTTDGTIEDVVQILKSSEWISTGDVIINTGAMPLNKRQRTNFCKITMVE